MTVFRSVQEVSDRIDELELDLEILTDTDSESLREKMEEVESELKDLKEVYEDYLRTGNSLIPEDEFEDYAYDLALQVVNGKFLDSWPGNCIDWEQATKELSQDYTEVEILGRTYYTEN